MREENWSKNISFQRFGNRFGGAECAAHFKANSLHPFANFFTLFLFQFPNCYFIVTLLFDYFFKLL